MKSALLLGLLLVPTMAMAQDRSSDILSWESIRLEKGYILSNDLYNNRLCGQIYSKQIPEFKKKNPQVKNPDLLFVDQTIIVQNCVTQEEPKKEESVQPAPVQAQVSQEQDRPSTGYVGLYSGGNWVTERGMDSEKLGYNLGIKIGYEKGLDSKNAIGISAGYLHLNSTTQGGQAPNGRYEVKSNAATIQADYNRKVSESVRLGALVNVLIGDDTSLAEVKQDQPASTYAGLAALVKLSEKIDLETNLQHRVDDISRTNMLLNLGLRFNFN